MLLEYQSRIIQQYGDSCTLQPLGVHSKYPFSCLFSINNLFHFSQEVLHFLWYFCDLYTISIQFPLVPLYEALMNHRCSPGLNAFLRWFGSDEYWISTLYLRWVEHTKKKIIIPFLWFSPHHHYLSSAMLSEIKRTIYLSSLPKNIYDFVLWSRKKYFWSPKPISGISKIYFWTKPSHSKWNLAPLHDDAPWE